MIDFKYCVDQLLKLGSMAEQLAQLFLLRRPEHRDALRVEAVQRAFEYARKGQGLFGMSLGLR